MQIGSLDTSTTQLVARLCSLPRDERLRELKKLPLKIQAAVLAAQFVQNLNDRAAMDVQIEKEFDPEQPRDEAGKWSSSGSGGTEAQGTLFDRQPYLRSANQSALHREKNLIEMSSRVKSTEALGSAEDHVNVTQIVTMEDDSRAVFKPASGENEEAMRDNVTPGQGTEREIAAWEVAKLVDMEDLATPCIEATIDGERGALLAWQEGKVASGSNNMWDGDKDSVRAAAFDYVTGNEDRHSGNWIVTEGEKLTDDKISLIDHGLCFPEGLATVTRGFLTHVREEEAVARVQGRTLPLSPQSLAAPYVKAEKAIVAVMEKLDLPQSSINGVRTRIQNLSKAETWTKLGTGAAKWVEGGRWVYPNTPSSSDSSSSPKYSSNSSSRPNTNSYGRSS